MAAGQPVVASDVPCLRELIRDGETGCLVPPGAPIALARRTRALLQDPARAHASERRRGPTCSSASRCRTSQRAGVPCTMKLSHDCAPQDAKGIDRRKNAPLDLRRSPS